MTYVLTEANDYLEYVSMCVAGALRPRVRDAIAKRAAWPSDSPDRTVLHEIHTALQEDHNTDQTVPWWNATGHLVAEALVDLTDVDEKIATYLIGGSLHALILGGQDTTQDNVLRLAERAACWYVGHIAASNAHCTQQQNERLEELLQTGLEA